MDSYEQSSTFRKRDTTIKYLHTWRVYDNSKEKRGQSARREPLTQYYWERWSNSLHRGSVSGVYACVCVVCVCCMYLCLCVVYACVCMSLFVCAWGRRSNLSLWSIASNITLNPIHRKACDLFCLLHIHNMYDVYDVIDDQNDGSSCLTVEALLVRQKGQIRRHGGVNNVHYTTHIGCMRYRCL